MIFKKKKLFSLILIIIPLLLVVGFSAWIISTTHKVAPEYTPNHTLADYFVNEDNKTYNTQQQYPSIKEQMKENDSFNEESFVSSLYFSYAQVDDEARFIGEGTYTQGMPTNAGRYSIRIAFTSLDADEDAFYGYFNIDKATLTLSSENPISVAYPTQGKEYVTTQNTLSDISLTGKLVHEINDENITNPVFDITTTGSYVLSGSDEFSVGTQAYTYTYSLENYNDFIGTVDIETYAIISINKSLSNETGSSYGTSIEVKGGSTYSQIKEQVNTTITNNGLDTDLAGYTYNGVSLSDASYVAVNDDLTINSNKTLFAHHELDIYDITYNFDCEDSSWASSTGKATYTYLDDTYTLPLLTRSNYTFLGWIETNASGSALSSAATPSKSIQILENSEGDKYFKAYWGFTVNFYDGDKNKIYTEDVIANGKVSKIPSLGIENNYAYTYSVKWTNGDGGQEITDLLNISITDHMNIYANITSTPRTYNVTIYYKDSDNQVSKVTQNTEAQQSTFTQVYDFSSQNKVELTNITYGQQLSVSKQIRVKDIGYVYWYTYVVDTNTGATATAYYQRYINAFYKSSINYFDWEALDYYFANNSTQNFSMYNTMVYLDSTYTNLTIVVGCEQATAIVHGTDQESDTTNPSTTTYYLDVNDAFLNIKDATTKTFLRVYGHARYESNSSGIYHCWSADNGASPTNAAYTYKINGINYTFPSYVFETSNTLSTEKLGNTYTINSNMNIILPYGREQSTKEAAGGTNPYHGILDQASTTGGNLKSSATVQSILTIPQNMTINVDGLLVVGGYVEQAGAVMSRGSLMNNGLINVNSKLVSYGYVKGSGKVYVGTENSGAELIDIFYIQDWPGGSNALGIYNNSDETVFPIECYSFHNVSCETIVYNKSSLYGFSQVNMSDSWAVYKNFNLIGQGGLFQINNGKITKNVMETTIALGVNTLYTSSNQNVTIKDIINVEGSVSDNQISLDVKLSIISKTITTGTNLPLPIGFMEINFLSGSSTMNKNSYMFLPGSKLYVAEGATLNLSNSSASTIFISDYLDLYAYDQDGVSIPNQYSYNLIHKSWYDIYWPTYSNSTPGNPSEAFGAKCVIDGNLIVAGNFGGKITSNSKGKVNIAKNTAQYKKITNMVYKGGISAALSGGSTVNFSNSISVLANGTIDKTEKKTFETNKNYTYSKDNLSWGKDITLSYVTNNNQTLNNVVFESGSLGISISNDYLPTLSKNHYSFGGWLLPNGSDATNALITDNTTITAKWNLNNFNINYVHKFEGMTLEGVINDNITQFNYETGNISLTDASYGNYIFMGWYLDDNYHTQISQFTGQTLVDHLVGNNVTLYSKWISNYAIKYNYGTDPLDIFNVNETSDIVGTIDDLSSYRISSFDYSSIYGSEYLVNPNKQYYFDGWYDNASFNGTKYTSETVLEESMFTNKQLVLYAKWVEKPYHVKYGSNSIEYYYTVEDVNITNRAATQGYETIWFISSDYKSETYYRSSSNYSGSEYKLYGEDYYVIDGSDSLNTYNNQSNIIFANNVDLSSVTLSITGNKDSESGITVTGKFAQGVIQKLIFESFQNLESGAYTEGTYSVSGSCGSSTSYYNLFYHGIFNGNTNLSQVIIKEGLVIPAYTFSNCGGVGNKVISSNGAEYNKEVYWPINKAKQTSKPQPVTPTSSITVQNSNISNKEEDDNTINVSYGLFGFMLLIVVGFVVFLIKKVVKH